MFYANVLTPDRIPEFFIPPKFAPQQNLGAAPYRPTSTVIPPAGEKHLWEHCIVAPECWGHLKRGLVMAHGHTEGDSTDWDPTSQAALSLPHFARARTPYGFCTLLESPHTRRKESLFHDHPSAPRGIPVGKPPPSTQLTLPSARLSPSARLTPPSARLSPSAHLTPPSTQLSPSDHLTPPSARLSPSAHQPSPSARPSPSNWSSSSTHRSSPSARLSAPGLLSSEPASSPESSPPSRPRLPGSPSSCLLLRALGRGKAPGRTARKGPRTRPRRDGSLSSSTDSSPDPSRRAHGAHSTPGSVPLGHGLVKESIATLGGRGILRLRAEYCSERQRVWLRLLSLEGLYEQCADCRSIGCRLSLYLEPGKAQKQRSVVIRRSRNPIFNQDFFFDGISGDQLDSKYFKIKVINKVSSMKRDLVLGVSELCLASILPL